MPSLQCPECGNYENAVIDSRPGISGDHIRRNRRCECGHTWTTVEISLPRRGAGSITLQNILMDLMERNSAISLLEKIDEIRQSIIDKMPACPASKDKQSE